MKYTIIKHHKGVESACSTPWPITVTFKMQLVSATGWSVDTKNHKTCEGAANEASYWGSSSPGKRKRSGERPDKKIGTIY